MKKLLVLAVSLALLAGCANPLATPVADNTIKIGAVISLTGPAAIYGENSRDAMNLAVEEINGAGGIDGKKIELQIEDDHTAPKDAVSAFHKLASIDHVSGIIGSLWDFTTQPLFPLALQYHLPVITPTNFRIVNGFELNKNFFSMFPEFEQVYSAIDPYILDQNIKTLGIVRFASAFGEETSKVVGRLVRDRGGRVVEEKYNTIGGNDFGTIVLKLKSEKIDAVMLDMIDIDAANFLQRAKTLGLNAKIMMSYAARDLLANQSVDKKLLDGIVFIDWELAPASFVKKFQAVYGKLPFKNAERSYDAIYVMANALAKSGSGMSPVDFIAQNEFETMNGKIKFTPEHTVTTLPVQISVIKNGQVVKYEK